MGKEIVGVGNPLVDILISTDEGFIKRHGLVKGGMTLVGLEAIEKILSEAGQTKMAPGGSTANILNALGVLKIPCSLVGKVGQDDMGDFLRQHIKTNNVSCGLINSSKATGRVVSLITPDQERTFATYLGAAQDLSADDLTEDMFRNAGIAHMEGYLVPNQSLASRISRLAKHNQAKISLDMASFNVVDANKEFFQRLIDEFVDIIFANEEEARSFTGREPEGALEELSKLAEIAVVKIGEKGSLVKRGKEFYRIDAIKAAAIDTTGAGDLYAAGFLYGLTQAKGLKQAAEFGAYLAGKVTEVIGASLPREILEQSTAVCFLG